MDLSLDASYLLNFLFEKCHTPDQSGSIEVQVDWQPTRGKKTSLTKTLESKFSGDWNRLQTAADSLSNKGLIGLHKKTVTWDCWITEAGRKEVNSTSQSESHARSSIWERVAVILVAFSIVGLIIYLAIRNEPTRDPNVIAMIRIFISVSVAALAATIPGFLKIHHQGARWAISAGGALAFGVMAYNFTPDVLPMMEQKPLPVSAPASFSHLTLERWSDPRFPSEIFGEPHHSGRPRQWMEEIELGACAKLEVAPEKARLLWYLSDGEYRHGLSDFTLYAYVGTEENAIVTAYLVLPDDTMKLIPLRYSGKEGKTAIYTFKAPTTRSDVRVLVFVAIKEETYNNIKVLPKFTMRSQPLSPA